MALTQQDYFLKPGESLDLYNKRIAQLRGDSPAELASMQQATLKATTPQVPAPAQSTQPPLANTSEQGMITTLKLPDGRVEWLDNATSKSKGIFNSRAEILAARDKELADLNQTNNTSLTPQDTLAVGGSQVATPEQQAISKSLQRLDSLYEQLSKQNTNPTVLADLDRMIQEQQLALTNLTPEKYLQSEPGLQNVGINQEALDRRVAQARDPIAGALTKLLIGRSAYGATVAADQQRLQQQIQLAGQQSELELALAQLSKPPKLDTEIVKEGDRAFLINKQTGQVIKAYDDFLPVGGSGKLLSPSEAASLGVPFGTTEGQAAGKMPETETQKQNALDAQTVSSAFSAIEAIAKKVGKTPETLTEKDANKMSDIDIESIGKALARIQNPDIARMGGDAGNALAPESIIEKGKQALRSWFKGKKYLPSKVIDAVEAATALRNQRVGVPILQTKNTAEQGTLLEKSGLKFQISPDGKTLKRLQ